MNYMELYSVGPSEGVEVTEDALRNIADWATHLADHYAIGIDRSFRRTHFFLPAKFVSNSKPEFIRVDFYPVAQLQGGTGLAEPDVDFSLIVRWVLRKRRPPVSRLRLLEVAAYCPPMDEAAKVDLGKQLTAAAVMHKMRT